MMIVKSQLLLLEETAIERKERKQNPNWEHHGFEQPWATLFILRAGLRFRYFAAGQTQTSFLGRFQLPSSLINRIIDKALLGRVKQICGPDPARMLPIAGLECETNPCLYHCLAFSL